MCGITGILDLKKRSVLNKGTLEQMTQKLKHRGPDASAVTIKKHLGIGFRRLSIIDIETGMQPITNEDNTISCICNGEIYNYHILKKQLRKAGHEFKTKSDVEVLVHLYEEKGTSFLNDLNGQFAFVIYDEKKDFFFAARDHFGIAPFFYTEVNDYLIFGSEIKAILEHPDVKPYVNLTGLDQILTFPGLVSPQTMFKDIYSLPPSHMLTSDNGASIELKRYWDLTYPKLKEADYPYSEEYYLEQLKDAFSNSVKLRLQADVKTGVYLSGGLDSALIGSFAKSLSKTGKVTTFSVEFEDEELSEAKYQRRMASYLHSQHNTYFFTSEEIATQLQRVIYHTEMPLRETLNVPSLALSGLTAATDVKVILSGQGADELFAGYVGYRFDATRNAQKIKYNLEDVQEMRLRNHLWNDPLFFYERDYLLFRSKVTQIYSQKSKDQLGTMGCLSKPMISSDIFPHLHPIHKRSYVDFKCRLSDHLLSDLGDRMSFANGIECRYPFLDQLFVNCVTKCPPELKLNGLIEKYALKKVASNYVPDDITHREKFGFTAPASPALIRLNHAFINDLLSYETIRRQGYFNPDTVEALKKTHQQKTSGLLATFEDDFLTVIITFNIFLELFKPNDLF